MSSIHNNLHPMLKEAIRRMDQPKILGFDAEGFPIDNPEYLPSGDTQIGVEFAIEYLRSTQPASTALVEKLMKALEPFADACFNDNGDITVDLSFAKSEDFIKAYFVHRSALSASTSREGESRG